MKKEKITIERRTFSVASGCEIRASKEDDEARVIEGLVTPFGKESEDMGFVEVIQRGAFDKVLRSSDAVALFNHDANFILGRQSAGTVELKETKAGLETLITPPDTRTINDLVMVPMERGELKGMSFSFRVAKNGDKFEELKDGRIKRTITEVSELLDVGPVTFPAYPDSNVQARSFSVALDGLEVFKRSLDTAGGADSGETAVDMEDENIDIDLTLARTGETL